MLLTTVILTAFVLFGLGVTVGLLSLLEALSSAPSVSRRRVDTRRQAADSLVLDADSFLAHTEMIRNVAQSA